MILINCEFFAECDFRAKEEGKEEGKEKDKEKN